MAGLYRPRHSERTALYRVLFHYFDRFLVEYKSHFERQYGFLRPIIKEVVERYLDCGNPRCGFARIRCPDCPAEHLLTFSCRTCGFCPSCHAKRLEEWGEWMREELVLDVPHRRLLFTIPKMIRKVYEVDPIVCPQCSGAMKIISFLTEYAVVDRIINLSDSSSILPHDGWKGKPAQ